MSIIAIFHQLTIASVWPTSPNFPEARFWITSGWPTKHPEPSDPLRPVSSGL